jgi:hypothetical protein
VVLAAYGQVATGELADGASPTEEGERNGQRVVRGVTPEQSQAGVDNRLGAMEPDRLFDQLSRMCVEVGRLRASGYGYRRSAAHLHRNLQP